MNPLRNFAVRAAAPRGRFPLLFLLAACVVFAAAPPPTAVLLPQFQAGPMAGVEEIVFAVRRVNETDGHWYANLGYYAHDPDRKAWREGARLERLHLASGRLTTLLDDPRGGIRDPQVHYDGRRILFSYRKGGTEQYHLYEIGIDGGGLRQLTDGAYDDIEPTYLPDGGIAFVSTRCKRWVNCWLTQVAVLYRCDGDGRNLRPLSSNNEHDNTPWPLPDGRLLYTRWEYIDRSQVDYHHLWAMNPDGTGQINWYGNLHPKIVMIDAKPIPGTDRIVAIFSPGHGQREHAGELVIVDPNAGPDVQSAARSISRNKQLRDPWAFSETAFLAAAGPGLLLIDGAGAQHEIYRLPPAEVKAGYLVHEPRPLQGRPREHRLPDRTKLEQPTGRLVLADVYNGRNMAGVQRGEIKKLLVLEALPMPIHYTGGMDPVSYGGTFTLERVVGTVPVEPDGSAFFELPALRSFILVALDEHELAVKRMQSFLTVQPGETSSCLGCHEQRTRTPGLEYTRTLATSRPPSVIEAIAGVPDVLDFPRDVQPILDALCVDCHGPTATARGGPRAGRLLLTGDHGPMFSHSYYMLTIAKLFSDGRNRAVSNYAPRTLGSSASRIFKYLDGSHYEVKATPAQRRTLRLWIESGAAYPGTYAALGTGMIGGYAENKQVGTDTDWPTTQAGAAVMQQRCAACHTAPGRLLPRSLSDERGLSFWKPDPDDPRLNTSRHIVFNLTRPEQSLLLLAPLAKSAGGWGLCRPDGAGEAGTGAIFAGRDDPDYQTLLAMCRAGSDHLARVKRFDLPGFQPRIDWVREMKRYGVLPAATDPAAPIDYYEVERRYWRSLWHLPPAGQ
jgi:mono/diheme cytochrome c family protein